MKVKARTIAPGRLYDCPPCLPGEALSSWVWRVAARHRINPGRLSEAWGLYYDLRQNDEHRPFADAATLAFKSATKESDFTYQFQLRFGVLARFRSLWFDMSSKSPILQWCPRCFVEDATPYLRLRWRFRTAIACDRHRVLLVGRCPQCERRIQLTSYARRRLALCWHCGSELGGDGHAIPSHLVPPLTTLEASAFERFLEDGPADVGEFLRNRLSTLGIRKWDGKRWFQLDFEQCFGPLAQEIAQFVASAPPTFSLFSARRFLEACSGRRP